MSESSQRPIVCGTDFSSPATKAGDVAAAMAVRLGAPLLLVYGLDEHGELPSAYWPERIEEVRVQLHTEAGRLRRTGAKVEEIVADGAPDDGVVARAERTHARFVVVGASGHGAVTRWQLGSVSERIAESAWVPTLVLQASGRIEDWARGGKPLRVFVGADFTAHSEAAMSWAGALREIGPCEFTVGFVDRYAARRAAELEQAPDGTPLNAELEDMLRCDLRERATSYFPKNALQVRVLPTTGQVESHLLDMAAEAGADLIVIGTHQWHGWSRLRHHSVSRRILHTAGTSVAVVPSHRVVNADDGCVAQAHRVLVATDLSPHGAPAIRHAFSSLQSGGSAWLLHVASSPDEKGARLRELRNLIPGEALQQGFKVETDVAVDADPVKTICAAAERLDVDLICVGSRAPCKRTSGLGPTTLGVLAHSRRPVLVVPQQTS